MRKNRAANVKDAVELRLKIELTMCDELVGSRQESFVSLYSSTLHSRFSFVCLITSPSAIISTCLLPISCN
jgi:hypothetical protein